MNADLSWSHQKITAFIRRLRGLFFVSVIVVATPCVKAIDFNVFNDPLLTSPPQLQNGIALPDGHAISCPPSVDMNQPLALGDVIDLALCNNPQIKQAWASIKTQTAAVGEAKAAYLPTANASISRQNTRVNYPDFSDANKDTSGHVSSANINWRIFDFGGRSASLSSNNYLLQAALASHHASIQKSMAAVIQAYFDALTNQASLMAKEKAAAFAKSTLETSLRRESKGASAKSDRLQAESALAKAEMAASRANGDYQKSQAALIFYMGLPTSTKVILSEKEVFAEKQDFKDLDSWLEEAEREHPAIKAARLQWESFKQKVDVVKSAGLPNIDLVINYYKNGYPNQGIQATQSNTSNVGLMLSIPIFEGFATS